MDVSYMRMGDREMPSTVMRYTFPEWKATIFGESPGDFTPMNNGMPYGLVWALAPRHYHDSLDEPLQRPLSRHVSELNRIRKKYREVLFDGRFRANFGASVTGGGHVGYSVFENTEGTTRACVLVNYGDKSGSAAVSFAGAQKREVNSSATPFEEDRKGEGPAAADDSAPPPRRGRGRGVVSVRERAVPGRLRLPPASHP